MDAIPAELVLKMTPPRVPRLFATRESLNVDGEGLREAPALLLQAPAGYGKTSVLASWRLQLLARGVRVAWLSCGDHDDESSFLEGLLQGVRLAAGKASLAGALSGHSMAHDEALTRWLAEVTLLASDMVLVLDDVERLSTGALHLLACLLHKRPPNLRVLFSARADCKLPIDELLLRGQLLRIGTSQLCFTLVEALDLARKRLGECMDADAAARLHRISEGWPLGLQMLLTLAANGGDLSSLGTGHDGLSQTLLELLFSTLTDEDLHLLENIAVADTLHEELCVLLSGRSDAGQRLARLATETPLIVYAERGGWLRLHALARENLRHRLRRRPAAELRRLNRLAADWLASRGLLDAAAAQAWSAGEHQLALALAERSLYDALVVGGRHSLAMEWLARLPEALLEDYPRLQLTRAWTLSISERHDEARRMVERILANAGAAGSAEGACGADEARVFECRLILGAAAVYADQPDRFAALHGQMQAVPAASSPLLRHIFMRRGAWHEHLIGQPGVARRLLRQLESEGAAEDAAAPHWSLLVRALSHLWEGQVGQVVSYLRRALERVERDLGRRSSQATMLASLLAASLWELGETLAATAMLADRLDVLERSTLPQTIVLGFCTAARMASSAGAEGRALELLAAMDAVGRARGLPRLRVLALTEQVRLHARQYRPETCQALLQELDRLQADPALPDRDEAPIWWSWIEPAVGLARGLAAIAERDWRRASTLLTPIAQEAGRRRLGRLQVEAQALHAFARHCCGEHDAEVLIRETIAIADGLGLRQVFADAHPELGEWVHRQRAGVRSVPASPMSPGPMQAAAPTREQVAPSNVLTPKERQVLELLERSLSNKEIGMALQVGEQTIKWHLKNLFAKLGATTRKQAVARARLLGLLVAIP